MTCEPYNEQRTKIFPDIRRDRNDRARARERERERRRTGGRKGEGEGGSRTKGGERRKIEKEVLFRWKRSQLEEQMRKRSLKGIASTRTEIRLKHEHKKRRRMS